MLKGCAFDRNFNVTTLQHFNVPTKIEKQLTIKKIHPIFAVRKIKRRISYNGKS